MMKRLKRLLPAPQRIVVGSAGKHKSVNTVKRIDECMAVGYGGNDNRCAPRFYDLAIVDTANCGIAVGIIRRNANHRTMFGLWKCGIYLIKIGPELKSVRHFLCTNVTFKSFVFIDRNGYFALDALLK